MIQASENGSVENEFISQVDSYHVSDELEENSQRHFTDTIPGDPNTDYPTYKSIPKTTFSCIGRPNWGYYADVETGCQVISNHVDRFLKYLINYLYFVFILHYRYFTFANRIIRKYHFYVQSEQFSTKGI